MKGNASIAAPGAPLPIDHMAPRAKGGSNRISNLTITCAKACAMYNQKKGDKDLEDLLAKSLKLLAKI
jgi:hypothetical protein